MDFNSIIQLGALLNDVKVPQINEDINFWMMRAKGGFFYDEFINDGFIALGWNYIDKKTSFDKTNLELVKEGIKQWYGDKVPTTAINKCKKFIEEFKEGDFVVIPNKGSSEVAICKVGEYYENESLDTKNEVLAIKKIENGEYEVGKILCPYKKRRKIELVLRISTSRIGYHLLRAISSYHGLNNLNDYAVDILNCIYDCYEYKQNIMFCVNIAKQDPLKARQLSKFMYGISELFCQIADEEFVSMTVNLNSPGKTVVKLEKAYKKIKKGAFPLLILSVALFGGGIGDLFETPGIAQGTINAIKEFRTIDTQIEMAEEELEGKRLDNYLKALEILENSDDTEIDVDKTVRNIDFLLQMSEELKFESNKEFAREEKSIINEQPDQ